MEFFHTHRRFVLIAGAILIVLTAGGAYAWRKSKSPESSPSPETNSMQLENTLPPSEKEPDEAAMLSPRSNEHLIKQAFSGTGTVFCTVEIAQGTAKLFVKKEMLRFTEITPRDADTPSSDEILTLSATVWVWNSESKKGYMMSDLTGIYSSSTVLKKLYEASDEELKEGFTRAGLALTNCTSENIDHTIFDLPIDVEFKPITDAIRDQLMSP